MRGSGKSPHPPTRTWIQVLGLNLQIAADDPRLVAPFLAIFGHFAVSGPAGSCQIRVQVDAAAGIYRDGHRTVRLAGGRLRRPHVHNLLYTTLVRRLENTFLLHAAALEVAGRALVVSAPSGAGKTSLARALARRGLGFLGDDLAPLGSEDGLLHPFPRRLGLDAENVARLGSLDQAVMVGDKHFLAPEALGMETSPAPLPLGFVVIMNPYAAAATDPTVHLTVGLVQPDGRFRASVQGLPGIQLKTLRCVDSLPILELVLTGARAVAAAMQALAQADEEILFHSRSYAGHKSYAAEPALHPLSVRETAMGLLRETLNREPQSALMRQHDGQIASVLFHLACLLEGVPCFHLTPGPLEPTADLLVETCRRHL